MVKRRSDGKGSNSFRSRLLHLLICSFLFRLLALLIVLKELIDRPLLRLGLNLLLRWIPVLSESSKVEAGLFGVINYLLVKTFGFELTFDIMLQELGHKVRMNRHWVLWNRRKDLLNGSSIQHLVVIGLRSNWIDSIEDLPNELSIQGAKLVRKVLEDNGFRNRLSFHHTMPTKLRMVWESPFEGLPSP